MPAASANSLPPGRRPLAVNQAMVALNCQAVLAMCQLTLPYLGESGCIVNIASVAAFQPIPYINVYAASKAFVLQLSRALNREVRPQGIRVMALCPFWTKTEFFDQAIDAGREQIVKKYTAMYDPAQIVRRAWRDLAGGRTSANTASSPASRPPCASCCPTALS